jgi:hypothetical protein
LARPLLLLLGLKEEKRMADEERQKTVGEAAPVTERKHPRYPYTAPVTYRELGPAKMGQIRNLSEGGLMVELTELYASGTAFDLFISLDQRSIRPQAEVVWSHRSSNETATTYLHGLRFTRLELQDRLTLELFLAVALDGKAGVTEGW